MSAQENNMTHKLKTNLLFAAAIAIACTVTKADTIKIGTFTLPYRFEDRNISDIVRHVVTNDVIACNAATTSFTPPFWEESGVLSVRKNLDVRPCKEN